MSEKGRLVLVDGSGYIFRAFHALPPMTRRDGTPVNAVYGFTAMLMKLIDDLQPDHVAVVFDVARKTFRSDIYPEYKANRSEPPEDLVPQFALVRAATKALSLPILEAPGFEADDLIATYARLGEDAGLATLIVSSDKDLMQLVRGDVTTRDGGVIINQTEAKLIVARSASSSFDYAFTFSYLLSVSRYTLAGHTS